MSVSILTSVNDIWHQVSCAHPERNKNCWPTGFWIHWRISGLCFTYKVTRQIQYSQRENWCEPPKMTHKNRNASINHFKLNRQTDCRGSWKDLRLTQGLRKTKPSAFVSRCAQTKDLTLAEVSSDSHPRSPHCGLNHEFHFPIYLLSVIPVINTASTEFSLYSVCLVLSGLPVQGGTQHGA